MDKLMKEIRALFLKHFREWYEKKYGEFDGKDMEHEKRWKHLYSAMWYKSGLNRALHEVKLFTEKQEEDDERSG